MSKSILASKINWTQMVAFAAMIATVFGIEVPEEQKVAIVAVIQGIQSVLTWVLRTFYTHQPIH
jgi:hypothetical protein